MKNLIIVVLLTTLTQYVFGQGAIKPPLSPAAIISMRYKDAYVKLTYSQPHKRGREIFGKLVPFGEVWRTGANGATEITATKDILLNSILLKAGTYSIFTIPDKIKWTIIINSDVGLWGAYNYNPKMDVFRFDVPVQELTDTMYEPFTITFDQKTDQADLVMMWDKTKISIPIRFMN
jgi:hypothetical protein